MAQGHSGYTVISPEQRLKDIQSDSAFRIDGIGNLQTSQIRRLFGGGFASTIDTTYLYTSSVTGSGANNAGSGVMTTSTGTTANSTSELVTKAKMRAEFGKENLFRAVARFINSGQANNVTFLRIYIDTDTEFGFRLNGAASSTNFEVYYKKAGSITSIANGSFNGNGTEANKTVSDLLGTTFDPTVFHTYEIYYFYERAIFYIDRIAVHELKPTTSILLTSLSGKLSIGSANSGGGSSNCGMELIGWGDFQIGAVTNNPLWHNFEGVAETRTLKGGGGTLHDIIIGKKGGAGDTLTIYDNTAASGTKICTVDLQNVTGNQIIFNSLGVNFYNGLTCVTTGTTANITILWE